MTDFKLNQMVCTAVPKMEGKIVEVRGKRYLVEYFNSMGKKRSGWFDPDELLPIYNPEVLTGA